MPKSKIGPTRSYWQEPEILTPAKFEIFIRDTLHCDVEFIPSPSPGKPDKNQVLGRLMFQITGHDSISYNIYAYDAQQFGADPYQMAKKRTGWHDEMLKSWSVMPVRKEELHSKYIHLLQSREEQTGHDNPHFRYHTNMICGYSWSESADGLTTVRYARDIKLITCPHCKKRWAKDEAEHVKASSLEPRTESQIPAEDTASSSPPEEKPKTEQPPDLAHAGNCPHCDHPLSEHAKNGKRLICLHYGCQNYAGCEAGS